MSETPNRILICDTRSRLTAHFGQLRGPIHAVAGLHPHLRITFVGGLHADIDTATAIALARQLPEALTALTALRGYPGCSGALNITPDYEETL